MKALTKLLLILLPFVAVGQNKTFLGVEFGPKFEIYQYADNGNGLHTTPFFYSPIFGLTIGQEINKTFTGETGFYINDYGESYRIEGGLGYGMSNALVAYQIPLRLKARLNLFKERLNITTTIGYTFAVNSEYGSSASGNSFSSTSGLLYNDSTKTQSTSTYSLRKTYGLLETGIAFEYIFKNSLTLYLATNYLTGFDRVVEVDVKYWINDGPEQTGTVFSNGDYYSVVFGIKYPISKFWANKISD